MSTITLESTKQESTTIQKTSIISSTIMDVFTPPSVLNKEVETKEIRGIIYYVDNENNVYNTYDVLNKKMNPRMIGHYCVDNQGNAFFQNV